MELCCRRAELEAALGRAEASGRLMVVKYYAPWCKACLNIKPLYEKAAEGVRTRRSNCLDG